MDKSGGQIDALDSGEYNGSLITLLNEGVAFVKRNMKVLWKKTAQSRIEMPDYCERSVFESIVNALVHRDYLINGSEVHIDIFDDRLVIYSPGGMADGTNIQERVIDLIPSIRRTPVLADIFSRLGFMERQGSGLNKIKSAYENMANYTSEKAPEFYSDRVQFTVTLKNLNFNAVGESEKLRGTIPKTTLKTTPKTTLNSLNGTQRKILKMIEKNPRITQKQIAEKLEITIWAVKLSMKKMTEREIIKRNGSSRNGEWEINLRV